MQELIPSSFFTSTLLCTSHDPQPHCGSALRIGCACRRRGHPTRTRRLASCSRTGLQDPDSSAMPPFEMLVSRSDQRVEISCSYSMAGDICATYYVSRHKHQIAYTRLDMLVTDLQRPCSRALFSSNRYHSSTVPYMPVATYWLNITCAGLANGCQAISSQSVWQHMLLRSTLGLADRRQLPHAHVERTVQIFRCILSQQRHHRHSVQRLQGATRRAQGTDNLAIGFSGYSPRAVDPPGLYCVRLTVPQSTIHAGCTIERATHARVS